jgi:hypothetical protein
MVIASTNSQILASAPGSAPSGPDTKCSCGSTRFSQATTNAPSAMPAAAMKAAETVPP